MHKKMFLSFLFFNCFNNCSDTQQKTFEQEYLKKQAEFYQKEWEALQKHQEEVAQNIEGIRKKSRYILFLLKDSSEEVASSESTGLKLSQNSAFRRINQNNTWSEVLKSYHERVEYYEKDVFKRPLTQAEKNLYCGHILEKQLLY